MQHPVHHEQIELEREGDADSPRLPPGGVDRHDHLAEERRGPGRLEIEREDVGRPAGAEVAGVEPAHRRVVDQRHVHVVAAAPQRGERARRGLSHALGRPARAEAEAADRDHHPPPGGRSTERVRRRGLGAIVGPHDGDTRSSGRRRGR
jgi:hypothetical protein